MAPDMKKLFALQDPRKADARVRDTIKHEVRKYVTRERKKDLPEGMDRWDFLCRVGANDATAERAVLKQVSSAIDAVAATGVTAVFVEVVAVPARRFDPLPA